ncbi:Excision repair cross-complementation group 1 [Ranunculus cassubicifolius]
MEIEEDEEKKTKKNIITIPSYSDVHQTSAPNPPSSLFTPSPSFSQAFSFIKSSEFYSTPPPPLPQSAPCTPVKSSISSQTGPSSSSPSSSNFQNRNAILVSHRQKGNPLLKHIRNVKWVFADVVCDYLLGQSSCALYLSLRYHLLHPDYLYFRIRELQKNYKLRVVLCHVDVEDVIKPLLEVTKTALLHECTLLCAWSLEECGRYLETIKVYENKPADLLQGQMDTDYLSRMNHALTAVRRVNKTDVVNLGSNFGSLSRIMDASMEDLARCPGIGEKKVKRLYDTFHEPFKRTVSLTNRPATIPNPEASKEAETSALDDGKNAEEESNKIKEQSISVKSALTAAFAKYSDKLEKKKNKGRNPDNKTPQENTRLDEK